MITLQNLEDTGALLTGHFQLSSGLHADRYLQCARLLAWPARAEAAGRALADCLREFQPQVIVSPALGGILIGHETARALAVPFLFAERREGAFALRRGFRLEPGERVCVVEDVFTTGQSTREVLALVENVGGEALAAGSIVDRGLPEGALPVPVRSLLSLKLPVWAASECPLCRRGFALETPGSRYQSRKP